MYSTISRSQCGVSRKKLNIKYQTVHNNGPISDVPARSQLHLSNYLIPYKIHFAPLFRPFWQVKCSCHKFTCSHLFALAHRPAVIVLTKCVIPLAHCQATSQRLAKGDNGQDVHPCGPNRRNTSPTDNN